MILICVILEKAMSIISKTHKAVLALIFIVFGAHQSQAQDLTNLGGDLTSDMHPFVALQLPAPNIDGQARFDLHISGHAQFHTPFDVLTPGRVSVGPKFNNTSCAGCHVNNGKGPIKFTRGIDGSSMLVKVSVKGKNPDGSPKDVPGIGEQLQDHQVKGKSPHNIRLRWKYSQGKFADGKKFKLRRPDLSFEVPGIPQRKILHSLRMTPTVIGVGLLNAVPDETLIAMADPADSNGDKISGKLNIVIDKKTGQQKIGRFGFRASHPTLEQQSAAALFFDMGVTSSIFPGEDETPEMTDQNLNLLNFYQAVAGVTPAINQNDPDVIEGKQIFQDLNCHACHVMTLKTGPNDNPELSNQEFHPFTDMLLHDMGPDLADRRKEFSASGKEWRTTPLWGLRLVKTLSRAKPGFLHDGRARNVSEAIIWHGGEAKNSRDGFMKLNADQRAKLLKFLDSI